MTRPASISGADWLKDPATQTLIAALGTDAADGPILRFVGGCVRNTLMGHAVDDIDIATRLTPERVIELAQAAGLKCVPTGLKHGTVTVIAAGRPFEVTTLRIDVRAHGRHADIAYTEDWEADARRRDFTINAIYADPDGSLFDPVGGIEDIAARRVRFIGNPHERIREDYLRILRFFRFHAWYGAGPLDPAGLAACAEEKAGLLRLSAERIQKELMRLLEASDPMEALAAMKQSGIALSLLGAECDLKALSRLIEVEGKSEAILDPLRRLAVLVGPAEGSDLGARLKLPNESRARLKRLRAKLGQERLSPAIAARDFKVRLYKNGAGDVIDDIVFAWMEKPEAGIERWTSLIALARAFERPKLPIDGNDVMALGVSGERIGKVLQAVEDWWITKDFAPSREATLQKAKDLTVGKETGK